MMTKLLIEVDCDGEKERPAKAKAGNGISTCELDPGCPLWEPREGCRREACDVHQDEECPLGECVVEEGDEMESCPCSAMVQAVHAARNAAPTDGGRGGEEG